MIPRLAFGKTGHDSTRVIFGAAALWGAQEPDAAPVLGLLLRYGINHIDVAASYGRAERRVGEWMPRHRDDFFLATKTDKRTYDDSKAQIRQPGLLGHGLEEQRDPSEPEESLIALVEGIIYLTKSDEAFYETYEVQKKSWF